MELQIQEIQDLTDRIRFFKFVGNDPLPRYSAGAHLDFELADVGTRSYS